eukprot:scaffold1123_cov347-Prasinococcus_capsulatus_cf.AAC.6
MRGARRAPSSRTRWRCGERRRAHCGRRDETSARRLARASLGVCVLPAPVALQSWAGTACPIGAGGTGAMADAAKKEAFRKYLEGAGVVDALSKGAAPAARLSGGPATALRCGPAGGAVRGAQEARQAARVRARGTATAPAPRPPLVPPAPPVLRTRGPLMPRVWGLGLRSRRQVRAGAARGPLQGGLPDAAGQVQGAQPLPAAASRRHC